MSARDYLAVLFAIAACPLAVVGGALVADTGGALIGAAAWCAYAGLLLGEAR